MWPGNTLAKGAMQELYLENRGVTDALHLVGNALERAGFTVRDTSSTDTQGYLKAIWGGKLKSYLVGHLPFGKLFKSGKRLGAEVEAAWRGSGTAVRVLVVPYMELFDRPETFLLSQGILEKLTDDGFSGNKLEEVVAYVHDARPAAQPPPQPLQEQPYNNPYRGNPAAVPYQPVVQTSYPQRRGGGLFWLLGLIVASVILYYFFLYAPREYTLSEGALVALGAAFAGGFISRKGLRGALLGFLVLFLPLIVLGVMILMGSIGAAGEVEGVGVVIPVITAIAGIILIGFAFALGFAGLFVGGIGGWIAGKIFPLRSRL